MVDSGKAACLLEWINIMDLGELVSSLSGLKDMKIISEIIQLMTSSPRPCNADFSSISNLLSEHFSESTSTLSMIKKESFEAGCEDTIAKVLSLLLSLSVSCEKNELFIHKMTQLSLDAQMNVRQITQEFFKHEKPNCLNDNFFDVLYREATPLVLDQSMNDVMGGSDAMGSFINQTSNSFNSPKPLSLPSTPIPSISIPRLLLVEEEIYLSDATKSIPRQRLNAYCSPMHDFLTSPAINYKIQARCWKQKLTTIERNLAYERQAKEEAEKILSEKEELIKNLDLKSRNFLEIKRQKEQLVEEVESLHSVYNEKNDLQKENRRLQSRIEQLSTSNESSMLHAELNQTIEANMKCKEEISRLRDKHHELIGIDLKLKRREVQCHELQERCLQQESAIEGYRTQISNLHTEQHEQMEMYLTNIAELKQALEDKNMSLVDAGETMAVVAEQQVIELQGKLHQLQSSWMNPEEAESLQQQLQQMKNVEQELQLENSSLKSDMNLLNERNKETVNHLKDQIQQLEDSKAKHQNAVSESNNKYKLLSEEQTRMKHEFGEIKEQKNALISRLKLEINELKAEISEWKSKHLQLKEALDAKTIQAESKLRDTECRMKEEMLIAVRQAVADERIQQNEKQTKILTALQHELSHWQHRASAETNKNDELMANTVKYQQKAVDYDVLQTAHDAMFLTNQNLQKTIDHMKAEQIEYSTHRDENNNMKQMHAQQIRSLQAQLELANTTIKQLQYQSTDNRMPLTPGLQDTPRSLRLSLDELNSPNVNKAAKNPGKLVRCYSDEFLSSPMNRQLRLDTHENDSINDLEDSLNDILSNRPSSSRTHTPAAAIHESSSSRTVMHQRVCINIESSLLDSTIKRRQYPPMRKQLSNSSVTSFEAVGVSNKLDSSRGSGDMNMNSSNLHNTSQLTPASNRENSAGRHSLLAIQTSEEPEDMDWGSLNRIAELQRRNAKHLPHLKSSYPVETCGNTPSRSGDNVRVGDALTTMRRMTQMTDSLQRSIANHQNMNRRMTINSFEPGSNRAALNTHTVAVKHKASNNPEDGSPMKTRRFSHHQRQPVQNENQWRKGSSVNFEEERFQEQNREDPRRQSVMFDILNTPKKNKVAAKKKETAKAILQSRSSNVTITKTVEKRSLMDRMRNPSMLNSRQRK